MCGPDLSTKPVASCRIGPHDSHVFSEAGPHRPNAHGLAQYQDRQLASPRSALHEVRAITRCTSRSELNSALHANLMDRIEALEQRLAELEQRLADVARRQAEIAQQNGTGTNADLKSSRVRSLRV